MTLIKYAPPLPGGGGSGLRNAVLSAQSKDFLTSSGLNVGILGGTICSIAKGFDAQGNPDDAIVKIESANFSAWTLPANSTCYLWVDDEGSFGYSTQKWFVREDLIGGFFENQKTIVDLYPEKIAAGTILSNRNSTISYNAASWRTVFFNKVESIPYQYFEVLVNSVGSGVMIGVVRSDNALAAGVYPGNLTPSFGYYSVNGTKYVSGTSTAFGSTYTTGDRIGIALDLNSGKVWASKNGSWQGSGNPPTGANPGATLTPGEDYRFAIGVNNGASVSIFGTSLVYPPLGGLNRYNYLESGVHLYIPDFGRTSIVEFTGTANLFSQINRLFLGKAVTTANSVSLTVYPPLGRKKIPLFFPTANTDAFFDIGMPGDDPIVNLVFPAGATGSLVALDRDKLTARSTATGVGLAILDRGY